MLRIEQFKGSFSEHLWGGVRLNGPGWGSGFFLQAHGVR